MKIPTKLLVLATVTPLLTGGAAMASMPDRPNIIHIFADDLGYGSLGYTGNTRIKTPSIDSLAAGGMILDRAYAATVCAPSRAMLMTGYHNGHTRIDRNGSNIATGFADEDITVAEILRDAGYSTALFGKWGFGGSSNGGQELYPNPNVTVPESLPNTQGFDTFYGYLNHKRAHSYWNDSLWTTEEPFSDNGNGIDEIGEKYYTNSQAGLWAVKTGNNTATPHVNYTHDLISRQSQQYIRDHAGDTDPFYMQVSYTIPHFDIDDIANAGEQFDIDGSVITGAGNGRYAGQFNTEKQRRYAAMISRMDDSIGALITSLKDPNGDGDASDSVLDNTLIIFTSDNGGTKADSAPVNYFDANGVFKGGKRDLYEGGVHVAGVMYWNGQIAAGSRYDGLTDLADFLPTAAELADTRGPVGVDGVSLAPLLTGQGIQRQRDYLIHEAHEASDFGHARASWMIVKGDYKLIQFNNGSTELYNIVSDPSESNNLLGGGGSATNQQRAADMTAIAVAEGVERPDDYFVQYARWTGADNALIADPANWNTPGGPGDNWSTLVENTAGGSATARVRNYVGTLGFEARGTAGRQTVLIEAGAELVGRNEVRIAGQGRIHLDDATLNSVRWTDVLDDGELTGHGIVIGNVYNAATVAPGRPTDLLAPIAPKTGVDTGLVTAIDFDFIGQDQDPMTSTSVLSSNIELAEGFSIGPGLSPRNANNAGNEFNVTGFHVSGDGNDSLAGAIESEDYLTFTIKPVYGVEMTLDEIAINLWRNGDNAAQRYAILTSLDGFTAEAALGIQRYRDSGVENQHSFSVDYTGGEATTEAVEVRVYGWSQGGSSGNTHFNDAFVTARFVSVPTASLDPTGVLTLQGNYVQLQDGALAIQIGGNDNTDPLNPSYDQMVVMGDTNIKGHLTVGLTDGYTGQAGDTFDILTTTNLDGEFITIDGLIINDDLQLVPIYAQTGVRLKVHKRGDANADGEIDQTDLDLLLANLGTGVTFGDGMLGDWNPDGLIDQADLNIVLDRWTSDVSPVVPEPGSAVLLVAGLARLLCRPG